MPVDSISNGHRFARQRGCVVAAALLAASASAATAMASVSATGSTSAMTVVPSSAASGMTTAPEPRAGNNLLWNGSFAAAGGALPPWSVGFDSARAGHAAVTDGQLCLTVERAAVHRFDVVVRQGPLALAAGHQYQLRFQTHATAPTRLRPRLSRIGTPATELWAAVVAADAATVTYTATYKAGADEENAELVFELGGDLVGTALVTVCLDDVELNDPQFQPPPERAAPPPPRVSVNQLGYLPGFPKIATVATAASAPLDWQLIDPAGHALASGKTRPLGDDVASGLRVHQVDFSSVTTSGTGLRLRVGADDSVPFAIGAGVYHRLKYDALAFFYLQRSGVRIQMPYAGTAAYARPAGHVGDRSVTCAPESPCPYHLDVSGGWYDAGDHGKYLVSSAISVWMLQNQYEALQRFGATAGDFADGKMTIPERANGKPDLLDEARVNLDFMLRMQVPAGQPLAGMAHHKVHDNKWSAIPTLPDQDTLPRYLRPPTTAATLDLAATAAQGARVWRTLDPPFAARCLAAAETAYAAAQAHPRLFPEKETPGGGAYGDGDLEDERYWAAAELFITTGKASYREAMDRSRFATARDAAGVEALGTLGWDHVAGLGKLSLALALPGVPGALADPELAALRRQIATAADHALAVIARNGYRVPLASDRVYIWGSNAGVLDAAVVLGSAYFFTRDARYAGGVIDCLDYILGRNPLAQSYVAGHGARAMRNPHHRIWAHQKDPALPESPPGAVSGGPNSMLQDPYIRKLGKGGCAPQTCYVDNVESYSTNEVAINWNAPLAWDVAFLDDLATRSKGAAGATAPGAPTRP
jgi:endoglucanase